jgi:hypothetical protein
MSPRRSESIGMLWPERKTGDPFLDDEVDSSEQQIVFFPLSYSLFPPY